MYSPVKLQRLLVSQHKQKQHTKQAGKRTRDRDIRAKLGRRKSLPLRTARQVSFRGLTLTLWNEDVNRVGAIAPDLAMKVSIYAWSSNDEERKANKARFWNDQKGAMKRDFEKVANILMDIHGGTQSAEGTEHRLVQLSDRLSH